MGWGGGGIWEAVACGSVEFGGRLEFQLSEPRARRWSLNLGSNGQVHSGKNRGWPHNPVALEIWYPLPDPCSV